MIIYPAVDIKNGRVVRLVQGKAEQESVYHADPAEPARHFALAGAEWVHVVDLDGAFSGTPSNWAAIEAISATGLKVQMGGGMRSLANVERAFKAGVSRVVIGTRAVEDKDFIRELAAAHGPRIAVGIDAKGGKVAVRGWVDTAEAKALDLARTVAELGVQTIIYTDISRDGMLAGPNYEAQDEMCASVPCGIIASGGVGCGADVEKFRDIAARRPNFDGVIIGKALYEGRVTLPEVLAFAKS